jgi:hypothetical protein
MSKNEVASRSHPEDSRGEHSKASQKPSPANASVRDNIDIDEAKGGVKKVVATPAHVGPQNQPGQERDALNESQINRVSRPVPQDAKEVPGGAAKARRAGPHGKQIHADGSNDATSGKSVARIG